MKPRRHRSIWISDLHLGTRACKAELLLDFLERNESEYLYLVGDVVDGWAIKRSWYWNDDHNRVLQAILRKSSAGTRVTYISGNHDEFLREFTGLMFGGVAVKDEALHETADGRRLLVLHGDLFDACVRNARWLALLGDQAYRACVVVNGWLNFVRRRFGYEYWSLAGYLKEKVKNAVSYVASFETAVLEEAKRRDVHGVVCGHIHRAVVREIDGVLYANDGDWVDSCTALVEDHAGRLEVLRWAEVLCAPLPSPVPSPACAS